MSCTNKIKNTCGTKNYATCIEYQGTVSDNTTLTQTSCLDIENIAEDLYAMIDIVKSELNLTALTSDCQTLPTTKTVSTLVDFLLEGYCTQKTQIDALIEQNVTQAEQIDALQNSVCP